MTAQPVRDTPGVFRAPNGTVLHLYLPDYVQGHKARAVTAAALCAAQGWGVVWLDDVPSVTPEAPFRWCGKCLGLALVKFGLTGSVVEAITPYFRTAPAGGEVR